MKNTEEGLVRAKPKNPNKQLAFHVPVTPSVNHMYINTKAGGRILNNQAKQYIKDVQLIARNAMKDVRWNMEENVWYHMDLYFYFPDRRKRDSHNCLKLLLDCFEGLIFDNDYFIMPRIQRVDYSKENPGIDVIFTPMQYEE